MKRPFPDHEAADAEQRKQVALFRYGAIANLIHLERGQRGSHAKLREKAAREWDIPLLAAPQGRGGDAPQLALRLPARGL